MCNLIKLTLTRILNKVSGFELKLLLTQKHNIFFIPFFLFYSNAGFKIVII